MTARPLRQCRARWLQGRRCMSAANALGDPAARSFAVRVLNRRRAEYRRAIREAEARLAAYRATTTARPSEAGQQEDDAMRITLDLPTGEIPLRHLHDLATAMGGQLRYVDYGRSHFAVRCTEQGSGNSNVVKMPRHRGQYVPNPPAADPLKPIA